MNLTAVITFIGGTAFGYFICLYISTSQEVSKPLEPLLMDCYDCSKKIAPPEFVFYGGLCKECYKIRHPEL